MGPPWDGIKLDLVLPFMYSVYPFGSLFFVHHPRTPLVAGYFTWFGGHEEEDIAPYRGRWCRLPAVSGVGCPSDQSPRGALTLLNGFA